MIDVPKFWRSLGYALNGVKALVKSENNARIHFAASILVAIAGLFFRVSATDWLWLSLAIALVWLTETVNTALEKLVNLVSPDYHPLAGQVKDLAAAAVLISAVFALIVAVVIFIPLLIEWANSMGFI